MYFNIRCENFGRNNEIQIQITPNLTWNLGRSRIEPKCIQIFWEIWLLKNTNYIPRKIEIEISVFVFLRITLGIILSVGDGQYLYSKILDQNTNRFRRWTCSKSHIDVCLEQRHTNNESQSFAPSMLSSPSSGRPAICCSTLADRLSIVRACGKSAVIRHRPRQLRVKVQ